MDPGRLKPEMSVLGKAGFCWPQSPLSGLERCAGDLSFSFARPVKVTTVLRSQASAQ